MSNDEAKQRAKNYMSLKGALEPKQIKCYCGHTSYCDCSPLDEAKQETLEEAAEKYAKQYALSIRHIRHIGFEDGAKWQAERMYSEEDMRTAIFKSFLLGVDRGIYSKELEDKLIEQFKKK